MRRGKEKFFVQCKQWRAKKVGVEIVRELYGVMSAHGATGGFVVTSGSFTEGAEEFAAGRNIVLIDGPKLLRMIDRAERAPTGRTSHASPTAQPTPAAARVALGAAVQCPVCASAMVRRVAKRGDNVGSEFWGCSKYPACRGTRAVG